MKSDALISDCGDYRYWLSRTFEDTFTVYKPVLFIMLNPSTADASLDDPTITRCIGFAKLWGHLGLTVANLYAYRATKPRDMLNTMNPEGPENDKWLQRLINDHYSVVCAWGTKAEPNRVERFKKLASLSPRTDFYCLGTNKNGSPRHPLFLKSNQKLIRWP